MPIRQSAIAANTGRNAGFSEGSGGADIQGTALIAGVNAPGPGGGGGGGFSASASSSGPRQGVPDLINQAAENAIKRLDKSQTRQRRQLESSFTERGLRQSGLASGAVEELGQKIQTQQRDIERQRINKLAELQKSRQRQQQAQQNRLRSSLLSSNAVLDPAADNEDQGAQIGLQFGRPGSGLTLTGDQDRAKRDAEDNFNFDDLFGGDGGGGGNTDRNEIINRNPPNLGGPREDEEIPTDFFGGGEEEPQPPVTPL